MGKEKRKIEKDKRNKTKQNKKIEKVIAIYPHTLSLDIIWVLNFMYDRRTDERTVETMNISSSKVG